MKRSTETYFSNKDDLQQVIFQELDRATIKVLVAVAWFTDRELFGKLLDLQRKGVIVELIINNHHINDQSNNDFEELNRLGGVFLKHGSERATMHHKFCVVDYDAVISGSYNWTYQANNRNDENIIVQIGFPETSERFVEEFQNLKVQAGLPFQNPSFDSGRILKLLELISNFLALGDTKGFAPYLYEIREFPELRHIYDALREGEYETAANAITTFTTQFSQVMDVSLREKNFLLSEIRILSTIIRVLELEKVDLEAKIRQWSHRYVVELNPLIAKLLDLKKRIARKFEKYGVTENKYQQADEEFRRVTEELEVESEQKIPVLGDEKKERLKKMHRESVKWCHEDSPECIFQDKAKAREVFSRLSEAYKMNDLDTVEEIWQELQVGNQHLEIDTVEELSILRARKATLETKREGLLMIIRHIKETEPYLTFSTIGNWDDYFTGKNQELEEEYQRTHEKFVSA